VRTRDGNLWSDDTVADCIRNPLYRGLLKYQEIVTPIPVERIIPEILINTVDILLESTAFNRRPGGDRKVHVLTGILTCNRCGYSFKAHIGGHHQYRYLSYVCRGKKDKGICDMPKIGSAKAERMIVTALENALRQELDRMQQILNEPDSNQQDVTFVNHHRSLMEARNRVVDLHVGGIISKEDAGARIANIDKQLAKLPQQRKSFRLTPEELTELLDKFPAKWYSWDDDTRRSILTTICSRIIVKREVGLLTLTLETCLSNPVTEVSEPE
jgi:hypothetical protein